MDKRIPGGLASPERGGGFSVADRKDGRVQPPLPKEQSLRSASCGRYSKQGLAPRSKYSRLYAAEYFGHRKSWGTIEDGGGILLIFTPLLYLTQRNDVFKISRKTKRHRIEFASFLCLSSVICFRVFAFSCDGAYSVPIFAAERIELFLLFLRKFFKRYEFFHSCFSFHIMAPLCKGSWILPKAKDRGIVTPVLFVACGYYFPCNCKKIKGEQPSSFSLYWCGKWDLNPYVKDTRPSNVPVCLFQHYRISQMQELL